MRHLLHSLALPLLVTAAIGATAMSSAPVDLELVQPPAVSIPADCWQGAGPVGVIPGHVLLMHDGQAVKLGRVATGRALDDMFGTHRVPRPDVLAYCK